VIMTIASILPRLKRSLENSGGTIVFGMEDGTVSIFGLFFGVAATTVSGHAVLIAGAAGAAAAGVAVARDGGSSARGRARNLSSETYLAFAGVLRRSLKSSFFFARLSANPAHPRKLQVKSVGARFGALVPSSFCLLAL
jgi:hypothetical protein